MLFFKPGHPLRNMNIAIIALTGIVIFGTSGYITIEKFGFLDALYMTIITISTVGFTEVHPLSSEGRVFTIFLISINIIFFTVFISVITKYFFDGHFQNTYTSWKMKNAIEKLDRHVIVCGLGRNGRAAVKLFNINKTPVVVIESSEAKIDNSDVEIEYYIIGDATRDDMLRDAGIETAAALITTLPDDAENVFIVLSARELNPALKIISRASNDSTVSKLRTAGAHNVIMPDKVGGTHMATLVLNPDVNEFLDYMSTITNEEFQINELAVNREIILSEIDCWHKTGATILGVKTIANEFILNPSPSKTVSKGDRIIAMGSLDQLHKVADMLR